jgi:hypothetical protein
MDYAVLRTQPIALLQREGRVAYRVLQLHLQRTTVYSVPVPARAYLGH